MSERFTETISTGIVTDNKTGKEYNCEMRINDDFLNLVNTIAKENEQLKKELAIYRKVASCGNCKYHNYDWYDDGDEFEVCDKGNDVTDGICEDWEEL